MLALGAPAIGAVLASAAVRRPHRAALSGALLAALRDLNVEILRVPGRLAGEPHPLLDRWRLEDQPSLPRRLTLPG